MYDHHLETESDIGATELVIEKVGSVTTIIVEMLQRTGLQLKDAEATLMALGIHSDTGACVYECMCMYMCMCMCIRRYASAYIGCAACVCLRNGLYTRITN